jgi:hypothetical protein
MYLNVTGVLEMPLGEFTYVYVKGILADGFSAYLNFSREFITVFVLQNTDNATNLSASRRLLYDRPVEYNFTAQFQIEINDKETYAKIENFTKHAVDTIRSITDANGFRIVLNQAELWQGYFTADGKPVSRCADGQNRVLDFFNKLLFCRVRTVEPENKPGLWWLGLVLGAALGLIIVAVVGFRKPGHAPVKAAPAQVPMQHVGVDMRPHGATFPAKLLFPATVSFEYQRVPAHLI